MVYLQAQNQSQSSGTKHDGALYQVDDIEGDDHSVFCLLVVSDGGAKLGRLNVFIAEILHLQKL